MTGIEKLYKDLGEDERHWLMGEFPKLVYDWVYSTKAFNSTDWLKLTAKHYKTTDALAVALLHLRWYYPVKLPQFLYRLTVVKELPKKPIILIGKKDVLRPLLSFTDLRNPIVEDRVSKKGYKDVVLKCRADPKQVLCSYKTLGKILSDGKELALAYGAIEEYRTWETAEHMFEGFEHEREFLVYMSKPIKCEWREA